jgi:hypothetical protein
VCLSPLADPPSLGLAPNLPADGEVGYITRPGFSGRARVIIEPPQDATGKRDVHALDCVVERRGI